MSLMGATCIGECTCTWYVTAWQGFLCYVDAAAAALCKTFSNLPQNPFTERSREMIHEAAEKNCQTFFASKGKNVLRNSLQIASSRVIRLIKRAFLRLSWWHVQIKKLEYKRVGIVLQIWRNLFTPEMSKGLTLFWVQKYSSIWV